MTPTVDSITKRVRLRAFAVMAAQIPDIDDDVDLKGYQVMGAVFRSRAMSNWTDHVQLDSAKAANDAEVFFFWDIYVKAMGERA